MSLDYPTVAIVEHFTGTSLKISNSYYLEFSLCGEIDCVTTDTLLHRQTKNLDE